MKRIFMKNHKKLTAILMATLLGLSLVACASGATQLDKTAPGLGGVANEDSGYDTGNSRNESGGGDEAALDIGRKIITNTDIRMESTDVPLAIRELAALARESGGYIQSQYQTESSGGNYYGELVVRIPADQVEDYVTAIDQFGNIRENKIAIQDVTADYTDTASRLANAQVQEERLLELFAEANTIDEMLYIQTELDRIQERIEVYEGQIRLWDNLIDMATISIYVYADQSLIGSDPDVPRFIPANTVWDRFLAGLNTSVVSFVNGASRTFIWLGENLIQIVVFAIIMFIAVRLIMKVNRKRKAKRWPVMPTQAVIEPVPTAPPVESEE